MLVVLEFRHVNLILKHERLDVSRNPQDCLPLYLHQSLVWQLKFYLVVEVYLELWPASLAIKTITLLHKRNAVLI